MNAVQHIWQKIAPNFLLVLVRFILEPESYKNRRKEVLAHFKKIDQSKLHPEIREGVKYLKYHKFSSFPYKWTQKYDNLLPEVFRDKANQSFYTLFDGKKMYFPKRFTHDHVIWAVRTILKEQDPCSPHLYLTSDFQVDPFSIVVDAGVAEGNFALNVVESAKRLFLVECEIEWMEALKLTFSPWKEKVIFIEKYMSDIQSDTTTSIDTLVSPEPGESYFIKLDIEGFEQKALRGMKRLMASLNHVKMDVCTYHHPNDLSEIKSILQSYGFKCQVSDSYVLYFQAGEEPSFRKTLIRAEKKCLDN
jgi:hypothetical protein